MDERWREAALRPPRAHGGPIARGRLRTLPEDFFVEEVAGFEPSGAGAHVLLRVRKREANTTWVAASLARICACRPMDVGYAGQKDRHAVTVQWFSVPKSRLSPEDWQAVAGEGFQVELAVPHHRKLPRGALAGNRFTIRVRDLEADPQVLTTRLQTLRQHGVPDYFGPQRFGRDAANLTHVDAGLKALKGGQRGFVLSAARSLVFNAVLAERVREGTWHTLEAGDLANLDGRGSFFPVETPDATLQERAAGLDIHPTGPLWGRGNPPSGGRIQPLEARIAAEFPSCCALVEAAGMDQERRSLRLAVRDLTWQLEPGALVLSFRLSRGSFATTVLAEILDDQGAVEETEG